MTSSTLCNYSRTSDLRAIKRRRYPYQTHKMVTVDPQTISLFSGLPAELKLSIFKLPLHVLDAKSKIALSQTSKAFYEVYNRHKRLIVHEEQLWEATRRLQQIITGLEDTKSIAANAVHWQRLSGRSYRLRGFRRRARIFKARFGDIGSITFYEPASTEDFQDMAHGIVEAVGYMIGSSLP